MTTHQALYYSLSLYMYPVNTMDPLHVFVKLICNSAIWGQNVHISLQEAFITKK